MIEFEQDEEQKTPFWHKVVFKIAWVAGFLISLAIFQQISKLFAN